MGNRNLKNALRAAGITPEEFAEIIKVDPKTVQRWVAGATTPYPRHRASISRALNLSEHDLWPEVAAGEAGNHADNESERERAPGCEVTGTWGRADDDGAPYLVAFINTAQGPIDVLDSCCGIQITTEMIAALLARADAGTAVRILTDGRAPRWESLLGHDQIELYLCEIPGEYWLMKIPERMLIMINLEHDPCAGPPPPILELTRAAEGGIFERLATRFEELWSHTGGEELARVEPDSVQPGGDDHEYPEPTTEQARPEPMASETGVRRWPRRLA